MDWNSPAPAKVNLSLNITGRRADGYHDLISFAAFTSYADQLTISDDRPTGLTISGPFAAELQKNLQDNLIYKTRNLILFKPSIILLIILFTQVFLGIVTLLSDINIYLASLHQISSILLVLAALNLYYLRIN